MIQADNIRRTFKSVKKEDGLKGSFKLLTRPQIIEHQALKGVSFTIEEGAFVGLIGANGAGKTTLLKILSGLIPPTTGSASVLGYVPFERSLDFRRSISLVMGQKAQLWWDLPAIDAFDLIRAIYEIDQSTYTKRLNELSNLLDVERLLRTQIRRLSLGERMKMELIGALLHWPKVIFLDEPTIGLDVVAAQKLREFLSVFNQKEKATIILTSHNMDDIERLCPRVMIIRSGEMIYDGGSKGLLKQGECVLRFSCKNKLDHAQVARVLEVDETALLAASGDESVGDEISMFRLPVERKNIIQTLQKLMLKFEVIDMGIEEQSLESVIQRIYETGAHS